jgi:hypothetical protein
MSNQNYLTTPSVPGTTTSVPGTTTSVPGTTTSVPATTTSVPATTTSVPATTTSVPGTTTSVPGTTTSVPGTTTSVPATTVSVTKTDSPLENPLKWDDVLIYGLLNPLFFGQILARMDKFNSSTAKGWLLIFSYIPFGDFFVLLYLASQNTNPLLIDNNNPNKDIFIDKSIIIPIMLKLILVFFNIKDTSQYFILFLSLIITNIYRRNYNCNNSLTVKSIGKIIVDSSITLCLTEIGVDILPKLYHLILELFPGHLSNKIQQFDNNHCFNDFGKLGIWLALFLIITLHLNFYNQINIDTFCNKSIIDNKGVSFDLLPFIIFILILAMIKIFPYYAKYHNNSLQGINTKALSGLGTTQNPGSAF